MPRAADPGLGPLAADPRRRVETSTIPASIDAALCPLCGESNACAMEAARSAGGNAPAPCWCLSVDFTAALKTPLPDAARGVACICVRCAARAAAESATAQRAA